MRILSQTKNVGPKSMKQGKRPQITSMAGSGKENLRMVALIILCSAYDI